MDLEPTRNFRLLRELLEDFRSPLNFDLVWESMLVWQFDLVSRLEFAASLEHAWFGRSWESRILQVWRVGRLQGVSVGTMLVGNEASALVSAEWGRVG